MLDVVEGESPAGMAANAGEHVVEMVVRSRTVAADGITEIVLARLDAGELPRWTPGAHVDLLLTPELTRQYSLCGSPEDRSTWRFGVLLERDGRGGSRHVHDELVEDGRVEVRGPRNHFPLVAADRYLFLAGGIGITPLLPMIAQAQADGADWRLHYGGRSSSTMAFLDELAGYGDRVELWPEDQRGRLAIDDLLGTPRPDTLVYACGPEPMLQAVEQRCAGWAPGSLHVERFSAKPVVSSTPVTSFEVLCQQSGVTVTVPQDRSILDVVSEAGVATMSSCQEGVCGTCETAVLEGEPDHRDSLLSEEEQAAGDYMMICVSRSCGPRLVLDL